MARIFISYKRTDKEAVFKIKDKVEKATGEKCWIDLNGIESDAMFKSVIIRAINECEVFLFLYSQKHAEITDFENDWTVKELNFASKKKKRVVFVNIDGSELSDFFLFDYDIKQQIDGQSSESVERMCIDLKKWLIITNTTSSRGQQAHLSDVAEASRQELEAVKEKANQCVREEFQRKKQQAAEETARKERERLEKEKEERKERDLTFKIKGTSFKMVKVDGGTFTMGATAEQGADAQNNERPTHQVTLSDYYIGQTEVTQALWSAVMGKNPSEFKGNNLPVEQVSWNDCQAFIEKLNSMLSNELGGKRFALPTEAQWEFAARGGNQSKGYKYAGSNNIDDIAWYRKNSDVKTHPVAQKRSNELGIYDMSGNVWEWCKDCYVRYSSNAQTDPQGPADGTYHVNRGGGWCDVAWGCRVSDRFSSMVGDSHGDLGFRLCLLL